MSSICFSFHTETVEWGESHSQPKKRHMLKESLLAATLSFHSWYGDVESPEERRMRLEVIAEAISEASARAVCLPPRAVPTPNAAPGAKTEPPAKTDPDSNRAGSNNARSSKQCRPIWRGDRAELAFLLLAQAYFETRLALHVHQGRCRSHLGECDSGRAIGLWQLQAGGHLPKERWSTLAGTDLAATTRAAWEAARALSRGRNYCGSLTGAVSLYATGRTCRWVPAAKRADYVRLLIDKYPVTAN